MMNNCTLNILMRKIYPIIYVAEKNIKLMVQINNSKFPYLNVSDKSGMKLQNAAASQIGHS